MLGTLHYTLGSGNSFKPALVLRQTGRACRMHYVDVLAGATREPAFLAVNPRGQVPYLTWSPPTASGWASRTPSPGTWPRARR